ncbi:hypothetical protein NFJ02_40g105420 [Pycnococcus provasolii]
MDAPAPPARSRTERRETSCMRVVRRFERENETNPREFSSLRRAIRGGVRGGAWRRDRLGDIQRVDGTLAWHTQMGQRTSSCEASGKVTKSSARRRALCLRNASHFLFLHCTPLRKPETGKSICQSSIRRGLTPREMCAGLLTSHGRNSRVTFPKRKR